jgi:hypothetical protein
MPAYTYYGGLFPTNEQISIVQNNPFSQSTLDASLYRDLTTLYQTQSTSVLNPFMQLGTESMAYLDPYSQAYAKTMDYSNLFGVSLRQGEGFYQDMFYMTGGKYIDYSSLNTGFSFDQAFAKTPFEVATHVSSGLTTPWTHYGTTIDTVHGAGVTATLFGLMPASSSRLSIQHMAVGTPTVFNLAGMHPDAAGQLAVHAYSSETAAMNRYLSNQYMYTKEGMPFIANASYYNPDSLGGSNWYFPGEISYTEVGSQNVGGVSSGYAITQGISGGPGYFPSYTGSGWTGSATGSLGVSPGITVGSPGGAPTTGGGIGGASFPGYTGMPAGYW